MMMVIFTIFDENDDHGFLHKSWPPVPAHGTGLPGSSKALDVGRGHAGDCRVAIAVLDQPLVTWVTTV